MYMFYFRFVSLRHMWKCFRRYLRTRITLGFVSYKGSRFVGSFKRSNIV